MEIDKFIIHKSETILAALSKINQISDTQILTIFVIDDNGTLIGSLTDGDIRRSLISGIALTDSVAQVMCTNFHYISNINDYEKIRFLKSMKLKIAPVLSDDGTIKDLLDLKSMRAILPMDAVLMAGGQGLRLKPHTNNIPKPLLDLAGKPIIAHNIDRLIKYGVRDFHVSVNCMKSQIKEYLNKAYKHINIHYIEEKIPLGTIGSVGLVKKFVHNDVLVMNADILTNIDFDSFFYQHKETDSDMLVATSNVRVDVPYAVLNVSSDKVDSLTEKPTYTYHSNAGIYLIKNECINLIPGGQSFDATDFVALLIDHKKNVRHFPIMGYWLDIGTPQSYAKAKADVNYVRF
ncbi:MAG: NTP transferase domain-containing protein [Holosporales bacterium]|jgi:dTDP-glucose pyrophosphorylase|nr:NTP transferase domain-containing protein [Holosporales bacterium]